MELYYTDSHGPDPGARAAAIRKLLDLGRLRTPATGILALSTKQDLGNYRGAGLLSDVSLNTLAKRGEAVVDGVTIYLHTERGRGPLPTQGPVLALDSSPSLLSALLRDNAATAVIFVPWMASERDAFCAANPTAVALT